jgi:hypothetical protein
LTGLGFCILRIPARYAQEGHVECVETAGQAGQNPMARPCGG